MTVIEKNILIALSEAVLRIMNTPEHTGCKEKINLRNAVIDLKRTTVDGGL